MVFGSFLIALGVFHPGHLPATSHSIVATHVSGPGLDVPGPRPQGLSDGFLGSTRSTNGKNMWSRPGDAPTALISVADFEDGLYIWSFLRAKDFKFSGIGSLGFHTTVRKADYCDAIQALIVDRRARALLVHYLEDIDQERESVQRLLKQIVGELKPASSIARWTGSSGLVTVISIPQSKPDSIEFIRRLLIEHEVHPILVGDSLCEFRMTVEHAVTAYKLLLYDRAARRIFLEYLYAVDSEKGQGS